MTDRPPFRNFVLLWLDGRVSYVRYRLPENRYWIPFMGADFKVVIGPRTLGGWSICQRMTW